MRFSPRSWFSSHGFAMGRPLMLAMLWLVYLASMMMFAAYVRQRFDVHPAITVTVPLAICYALGWLSIWSGRVFGRKGRPTTAPRRTSAMGAGLVVLAVLLLLTGLAVAVVEGIVVLARAWT